MRQTGTFKSCNIIPREAGKPAAHPHSAPSYSTEPWLRCKSSCHGAGGRESDGEDAEDGGGFGEHSGCQSVVHGVGLLGGGKNWKD